MGADTIDITWTGRSTVALSHEGPYRVALITGWEDLPPARVDDVPRSNRHGSFDAPPWAAARTVTVEGYCISPEARDQLLLDLARAMTLDADPGRLDVSLAGRTLAATARLTRSSRTLQYWGVDHFGWICEWWCPDPFRYGEETTATSGLPVDSGGLVFPLFDSTPGLDFGDTGSPGRITMTNPGTAAAFPRYQVAGPVPSGFELRLVETGQRLRWSKPVPAGSVVTLDCRTATASFDDSPGWDGVLTKRQWHEIPAEGSATVQFLGLGTYDPASTLTASWKPTWW